MSSSSKTLDGASSSGGGISGVTANEVIYVDSSGNVSGIVNGAQGTVLTSNPTGPPSFQSAGTSTSAHNLAGGAAGEVAYQTGSGATSFTNSSAGVFTMVSANGTPSFTSSPNIGTATGTSLSTAGTSAVGNQISSIVSSGGGAVVQKLQHNVSDQFLIQQFFNNADSAATYLGLDSSTFFGAGKSHFIINNLVEGIDLFAGGTKYFSLKTSGVVNIPHYISSPLLGTDSSGNVQTVSTVTVANGGTGQTTLSAHGVILGNGSSSLNVLSPGTSGTILTSNGISSDPSWNSLSVSLTSQVTGTLPVGSGGTGTTSISQYSVVMGNNTSAFSGIAPSTAGYVLTSNGGSSAPTFQIPTSPTNVNSATNIANGAIGQIPYQTGSSTTTFLASSGGILFNNGSNALSWTNQPSIDSAGIGYISRVASPGLNISEFTDGTNTCYYGQDGAGYLNVQTSGFVFGTTSAKDIYFAPNAAVRLRLTSAGKVQVTDVTSATVLGTDSSGSIQATTTTGGGSQVLTSPTLSAKGALVTDGSGSFF